MSMAPVRASTRVSIAWSGAPAFEDTDTLVLTINGCSLDLRIWTEGPDRGGIEWATVGGVSEGEGSTADYSRLPQLVVTVDGISSSSTRATTVQVHHDTPSSSSALTPGPHIALQYSAARYDTPFDQRPHTSTAAEQAAQPTFHTHGSSNTPEKPVLRWTPFIDSRPPAGSDEGAFSVLPNGDVFETGSMYNPKTRRVEAYEEVWRRFPCPTASPYCVLERVDAPWGTDGRRAFLGRLGKRALGLAANGDEFVGYRAEYEGSWKRVYEVGDTACLPRLPDEMGWEEGEVVRLEVGEWRVRSVGTTP